MSRARRLFGFAVFILAGGLALGGLVLWLWGDERIYPRLLEVAAADGAGLEVSANGPVALTLWPVISVTATDLDVAPAAPAVDWSAALEQIRLEFAGQSLFRGQLVPESVEIRGARVQIDRTAGIESDLMELVPVLTRARAAIDDARIEIAGGAGTDRHLLQIDHYESGPESNGHPRFKARGAVDGNALSIDARFSAQAERIGDGMAYPLTASVSIPGWKLEGTVKGHVAEPQVGRGLVLDTVLEIGDVASLAGMLQVPGALTGRLQFRATVDGDLPLPRLASLDAKLDGGDALSGSVEGTGIALASGAIESMRVRIDGPLPAGIAGKAVAVHHVQAEATVKGVPGGYTVGVDRARIAMAGKSRIDAHGTLELTALDDWKSARSRLQVKASTADVAAFSRAIAGLALPDLGAGELHGMVTGALEAVTVEGMVLQIGGRGPVRIKAEGRIGPLRLGDGAKALAVAETDVQVQVAVDDTRAVKAYLGDALATLKPWTGRGRVRSSPRHWHVSRLEVHAGDKKDVWIAVEGEARGRGGLEAGVERLISATLAKGDVVDLGVALETASAHATHRVLGVNVPELGALEGHARLKGEGKGGLGVNGLALRSTGALAMELTGDIGVLRGLRDVDLELTLAETSPQVIDRLLDLELPLSGNVSFKGSLRRPGQQVLGVDGEARVGSSRFTFDLTAEHTGRVPLVKGRIHSDRIQTRDFWFDDAPTSRKTSRPSRAAATPDEIGLLGILPGLDFVLQDAVEEQERAGKQVPEVALPWRRLRNVDIELQVHVDVVQGVHVSGGPLDLRLVDRGGRLEFGPSKLALKGGSVSLQGVADSNGDPPSLSARGRGENVPVNELTANRGTRSQAFSGQLSFEYDLQSRGNTLQELRAGLGGEIRSVVEQGRFPVRDLDLLSGSLVDWLITWMEADKTTPVPCAVADFTISGGVAEAKSLYLKTENSAAYGIGTIDLRTDSLDLTIKRKMKGLSLAAPATVRVHGPLASPKVELADPEAVVLRYGAEVAEALEFPPVLLLRGLLGKLSAKESGPCR